MDVTLGSKRIAIASETDKWNSFEPIVQQKPSHRGKTKKISVRIPSLPPNSCQSCHVFPPSFQPLLKTYQMPGLLLVPLFAFSYCFFITSLWKRKDFSALFVEEEIGNESDLLSQDNKLISGVPVRGPRIHWTSKPKLLITQLASLGSQGKWKWRSTHTSASCPSLWYVRCSLSNHRYSAFYKVSAK